MFYDKKRMLALEAAVAELEKKLDSRLEERRRNFVDALIGEREHEHECRAIDSHAEFACHGHYCRYCGKKIVKGKVWVLAEDKLKT